MTGLARLGLWSYNVYLWHYFVVLLPGYAAVNQLLVAHLHRTGLLIAGQSALFMVASILIGAVLTILVENPLLKLRNHWWPSPSRILPEARQG
jgi:peptidoglycan/LPS O-acetylase OafA/YrhL